MDNGPIMTTHVTSNINPRNITRFVATPPGLQVSDNIHFHSGSGYQKHIKTTNFKVIINFTHQSLSYQRPQFNTADHVDLNLSKTFRFVTTTSSPLATLSHDANLLGRPSCNRLPRELSRLSPISKRSSQSNLCLAGPKNAALAALLPLEMVPLKNFSLPMSSSSSTAFRL